MAEEKYMLISLDDEKAKSLADVLGNKTCKKIIDHLAVHPEASVKDLSDFLHMPMNTVEYNVKKLVAADLVQKRTNFFWSKKGKKIVMYELSNKSIIISPKNSDISSKIRSILPAAFVSFAGAFAVYAFTRLKSVSTFSASKSAEFAGNAGNVMMSAASDVQRVASDATVAGFSASPSFGWILFLAGALLALFIFCIVNWRKL